MKFWSALMMMAVTWSAMAFDDFENYPDSGAMRQVYREFDANNPYPDRLELGERDGNHFMLMENRDRNYSVVFREVVLPEGERHSAIRFRVRGGNDQGTPQTFNVVLRPRNGMPDSVGQTIELTDAWQTVTVGDLELAELDRFILVFGLHKQPGEAMFVEVDDLEFAEDPAWQWVQEDRKRLLDDYGAYSDAAALRQKYLTRETEAAAPVLDLTTYDNRAALQLDSGPEAMETICLREYANPFGAAAAGVEIDVADVSRQPESGLVYVAVRATPDGPDLGRVKIDELPRGFETYRVLAPGLGKLDKFFLVLQTARRDREEYAEMKYLNDFCGVPSVPVSTKIGYPVSAAFASPRLMLKEQMVNIIPAVKELEIGDGLFQLLPKSAIVLSDGSEAARPVAEQLRALLAPSTGFTLPIVDPVRGASYPRRIVLTLAPEQAETTGKEGYELEVAADTIRLTAAENAGLFYAMQSLRQLFRPEIESRQFRYLDWVIPQVKIVDRPEYTWRSVHFDTARHFFPKEYLFRLIDLLALQKLNTFHWHYNDGTAWRVESDAFPKLTEVGAWWGDSAGGFYTKEDVKAIVDYARERFITVVPEVEMPAHANAALYAYPDNACQKEQLLEGKHGDANTASWFLRPYWVATYCASREETYDFIDRLIAETVELFPDSKIIHIGGDELPSGAWEACPRCKAFMQEKGFAGEVELQNYFTRRVEEIVARHGRRALGWEQVMADNLRPDTMIHAYLSQEMVARAAAAGYEVFSNNAGCNYFDYYQGSQADEPLAITSGMTTVKQTYTFDPMARVPEELRSKVLGGQGALWTEFISTPAQADYMFFPRMTAMSEKVWSAPERCGWQEFERRLNFFYPRLSQLDVHYKDYRK